MDGCINCDVACKRMSLSPSVSSLHPPQTRIRGMKGHALQETASSGGRIIRARDIDRWPRALTSVAGHSEVGRV
jgi:hypothetical protein